MDTDKPLTPLEQALTARLQLAEKERGEWKDTAEALAERYHAANKEVTETQLYALQHARKSAERAVEIETLKREHAAKVHSDRERLKVVVGALRALVTCAASNLEGSIISAQVDEWVKRHREAVELLSIIDGQKVL